jgi:hypothetical protein
MVVGLWRFSEINSNIKIFRKRSEKPEITKTTISIGKLK